MGLKDLTWEILLGAALVAVLLIEIYSKVMNARKLHRDAQANTPIAQLGERVDAHDKMLASDKRRIENLEQMTADMRQHDKHVDEGLMVLMRSSLAMQRHMMHGNNIDGMHKSESEITDYLTGK